MEGSWGVGAVTFMDSVLPGKDLLCYQVTAHECRDLRGSISTPSTSADCIPIASGQSRDYQVTGESFGCVRTHLGRLSFRRSGRNLIDLSTKDWAIRLPSQGRSFHGRMPLRVVRVVGARSPRPGGCKVY